jgi:hypothetical protein
VAVSFGDPKITAALDLLRRTGLRSFQVRYSDDEQPTVWMAVGVWDDEHWECAAASDPAAAVMRLLDEAIDGGQCTHCGRPTGATDHWQASMPLATVVCWQVYDPELHTFRRSCA